LPGRGEDVLDVDGFLVPVEVGLPEVVTGVAIGAEGL